ncbi:SGNH/GDSL hydrolase family protein [uncultured Acinetobacter sp.]|uniref:SGNH/GDSL hydrolase family protein n=1 Tax=uncultured Acinetobacter sp. TaxID=165433 RepID=UPI002587FB76|nr:SGNH/GDSL hydrolase family protein [uncultured Acinetobacter sp.]
MSNIISPPFQIFTDITGTPLDAGFIYIGQSGQDPISNPLQVYWDKNKTILATQPLSTRNGYIVNNGVKANPYVDAASCSILVRNLKGSTVSSNQNVILSANIDNVQSIVNVEKTRAQAAETTLDGKINNETTRALEAESLLDAAIAATAGGYFKSYPTLAQANADIANIPLNVSVKILSADDGGDYYKATAEATSLTKSPYDPVNKAANYTNQEVKKIEPLIMQPKAQQNNLSFSVSFEDGTLTWLSADENGEPPEFVKNILAKALSPRVQNDIGFTDIDKASGSGFSIAFEDGTLTWLSADENGEPPQFVIDHLSKRLGVSNGTVSRIDVIDCLGDSLTQGGTGDGTTYPLFLAAKMPNGTTVQNLGLGGQMSMGIAIRYGAVILKVNANTIPTSGSVTFTYASQTRAVDNVAINGKLNNEVSGTISGIKGILNLGNGVFTPSIYPANPVPVSANSIFYPDDLKNVDREGILIFWAGQNDLAFGWPYITTAPRDCAKACIDYMQADIKRAIIIGVTTTTIGFLNEVTEQNNLLKQYVSSISKTHQVEFLDAQTMLTDPAILKELGVDLSNADVQNSLEQGLIPTVLTVDGVHFDANVKENFTAKQIKRIFSIKGWL